MSRISRRRSAAVIAAVAAMHAMVGWSMHACAQWPSDAGSPLVVGVQQGQMVEHSLVTTGDGAAWVGWTDLPCLGVTRLQRIDADGSSLGADGMVVFAGEICDSIAPRLAPIADGSVAVCRVNGLLDQAPVRRFAADGSAMWGAGVVVGSGSGTVGGMLGVEGGDVLIAWSSGASIFVGRHDVDGNPVWGRPASVPLMTGTSLKIFAVISDGADGAFVFWSVPVTYAQMIFACRVTASGGVAWGQPLQIVPPLPGASRHTPHAAISDGAGGAVLAWAMGADGVEFSVPIYTQRISADGSLMFEVSGRRVSLDVQRQFDPLLSLDELRGDVFIAWRDGVASQSLRAQRMTAAGERAWGETGVGVTPMNSSSRFEGTWNGSHLRVAVTDQPVNATASTVMLHATDGEGAVGSDPLELFTSAPATNVRAAPRDDAVVVTWLAPVPPSKKREVGAIVAHRVNADGSLGSAPVLGDLNGDGMVDGADLGLLLGQWGSCGDECAGDLNGDSEVDGADLGVLLGAWRMT